MHSHNIGNPYHEGKLLYLIDPLRERWYMAYNLQEVHKEGGEEGVPSSPLYSYDYVIFDHRPSLHEVAEIIMHPYNEACDEKILRGFAYTTQEETPVTRNVWLDETNQRNFLGEFTFCKLFDGINLPTIIKMGLSEEEAYYYKVTTVNQYKHFMLSALGHIKQCLSECWKAKRAIDLTPYIISDGKQDDEEAVS